jgi:hypothetical protein
MSKKTLRAVVVAASLVFLFAAGSFAFAQSEGGLKEYSGEVSFRYGGGFFLKIASGEEYKLVLGPPWYLENLGLALKNGDKASVKGYNAGYAVLYVVSLTKGAKTYDIADAEQFSDARPWGGYRNFGYCPGMGGYGPYGGHGRGMRGGR